MLNLEMIGQRIANQRKLHQMNQNDLAEALFVTRQAVSKWEMGKGLPSIEILLALTKLFNISIDDLLDDTDMKPHDYKHMLVAYPRASVVYRFLESDGANKHVKDIFYLLTTEERKQIIEQSLEKSITLSVIAIWPYASYDERKYIIVNLLSKEMIDEVETLYPLMTDEERMMVSKIRNIHTIRYRNPLNKEKKEG